MPFTSSTYTGPSRDGPVYVLEVNGIPGWQALQQVTRIDVAGAIVDHAVARARVGDAPTSGIAAELPA